MIGRPFLGPDNLFQAAGPSLFPNGVSLADAAQVKAPFTTASYLDAFTMDMNAGMMVAPHQSWLGDLKAVQLYAGADAKSVCNTLWRFFCDTPQELFKSEHADACRRVVIPAKLTSSPWSFMARQNDVSFGNSVLSFWNKDTGRYVMIGGINGGPRFVEAGQGERVGMGIEFGGRGYVASNAYYVLRLMPHQLDLLKELGRQGEEKNVQWNAHPLFGAEIYLQSPQGAWGPWPIPERFKELAANLAATPPNLPTHSFQQEGAIGPEIKEKLSRFAFERPDRSSDLIHFPDRDDAMNFLSTLVVSRFLFANENDGTYLDADKRLAVTTSLLRKYGCDLLLVDFFNSEDTVVDGSGIVERRVEHHVKHYFDMWTGAFALMQVTRNDLRLDVPHLEWNSYRMFDEPKYKVVADDEKVLLTRTR